jgi:uncharacterized membrane protein YfhO
MNSRKWIGIGACVLLAASTFMHWAWYPDIQKYFTGFFSEKNYYGKPGIFLCLVAVIGIAGYLLNKVWLYRINLVAAALGMAYAIKSFLLFTSSYDGYEPQKQPGIYVMLVCSIVHVVFSMSSMNKATANRPQAD